MSWYNNWFGGNKDNDTGGFAPLTNFSHNVTDKIGLPDPWNQFYGDPAKKQQDALKQAAQQMKDLAAKERAEQMEGLAEARAAYAPAHEVYTRLYGTPDSLKVQR